SNYKIPAVTDVPDDFRVAFLDVENPVNIRGSKAVGEPPFVLGISVWAAVKDALRASRGRGTGLKLPATREEGLLHLSGCAGSEALAARPSLPEAVGALEPTQS